MRMLGFATFFDVAVGLAPSADVFNGTEGSEWRCEVKVAAELFGCRWGLTSAQG